MKTGKKFGIKIFHSTDQQSEMMTMTEMQAMQALRHPNVIQQIEFGFGSYKKRNIVKRQVFYIVLELAVQGELFDIVLASGEFNEELCRFYFK